jgi:hypothetical protein
LLFAPRSPLFGLSLAAPIGLLSGCPKSTQANAACGQITIKRNKLE